MGHHMYVRTFSIIGRVWAPWDDKRRLPVADPETIRS